MLRRYPELLKRLLVVGAVGGVVAVLLATGVVRLSPHRSHDYDEGYSCGQTMATEPAATDMSPDEQMVVMTNACDRMARSVGVASMQEFHKGFAHGFFAGPDEGN